MSEPELITRRRRWSPTQKAALLEEVEDEGGKVAVVARRHGISESLLYNWRSAKAPQGADLVDDGQETPPEVKAFVARMMRPP